MPDYLARGLAFIAIALAFKAADQTALKWIALTGFVRGGKGVH